ncbi:hypothetical protein ABXT08_10390 [Chryseobacterium sp. NRRL B-14859]|uniref:hypothetical protein n=1 Tax=unclassified Chryseobacterium TaxID=2593645 RepID=UPI00334194C2
MDREIVNYIIKYFHNLMTDDEKLALKYRMHTYKISDNHPINSMMNSSGPKMSESLQDSYDKFELDIATRIMTEIPEKVFLNYCPKCNKLARTPFAQQCRYCRYSWHLLKVARFKINSSFQLTGRSFYLIGQLIEGEINPGQFIDLRTLGIFKEVKIESIEFALKWQNEMRYEDIALGIDTLTEEEKQYFKNRDSLSVSDIVCKIPSKNLMPPQKNV